MLNWASRFDIFCFMDDCNYNATHHSFDCLLSVGVKSSVISNNHPFAKIDALMAQKDWKFGHLSFDLKNHFYPLQSKDNPIGFADFFFFVPQHVVSIKDDRLCIESDNAACVYESIMDASSMFEESAIDITIQQRLTKSAYIDKINALKQHILRGDCYEINFCQEFYAEGVAINPVSLFSQLMQVSPNPFSVLYRNNDQYLLCASPERFIKKESKRILSQPIKGTAKRDLIDQEQDDFIRKQLQESQKERAENVMVVDLVRNDLSRICEKNSVVVDELFNVYSFPQVHQLISTISGQLSDYVSFSKIIEALFPMGSMTGAPKHRVLQLIDEYEASSRGLFSGSVGYITKEGDFDFNVVIRSILYNSATNYLSYQVGSGITFYSDAEKEWEECLLKAVAIKKVLTYSPALTIN